VNLQEGLRGLQNLQTGVMYDAALCAVNLHAVSKLGLSGEICVYGIGGKTPITLKTSQNLFRTQRHQP
jgi:hypothetical protein